MGISVGVRDGEPPREALARLNKLVWLIDGRPSHKRRFGYYEKPSELRRKRAKKQATCRAYPLRVCPQAALYARTGPSNALMR